MMLVGFFHFTQEKSMKRAIAMSVVAAIGIVLMIVIEPTQRCRVCGTILKPGKIIYFQEPPGVALQEMHCVKCDSIEMQSMRATPPAALLPND
jgi:lipopolysaccharide/colanic/teichoic acid biosynthesis glycosyltransferase